VIEFATVKTPSFFPGLWRCLTAGGALWAMAAAAGDLGLFEGQGDVGNVSKAGSVTFDAKNESYRVAGGGANIWFTNDAFHFVWKRMAANFALNAGVEWPGAGGDPHRKACLMVRQDLAPDASYVDVAVHGNGLVSLQFREAPGAATHEIQVGPSLVEGGLRLPAGPLDQVGLERQGDVFYLRLANQIAGNFIRLHFSDPVYVGLAVSAHNDQTLEEAGFHEVKLERRERPAVAKPQLHCTLETVAIASTDRRAIYHTLDHIEAPNWSRDGQYLLFNSGGHIYRLPAEGGERKQIDTAFADHCNNDHGLSPDGSLLAISDSSKSGKSQVYVLPAAGGTPRPLTPLGPSYWHGWSPDGGTVAYCAERDGEFDVYTMPAQGGPEKRLTTAKGLDDGPDYTPDGKYIYFNSERTGRMQIWRMKPDGSEQEQVTTDDFNNWFPHPSPDGKWLVFLTYDKEVTGHPANQLVRLRLMPLAGGPIQELARLFGGQGTINVPSWSPDSRQVAFVSYELIEP
jgi:Tol biopolymer transport system component